MSDFPSFPDPRDDFPALARMPLGRRLLRQAGMRLFRFAENNEDLRIDHNGEGWLLRELCRRRVAAGSGRPLVVFDAGANRGGYTQALLAAARGTGCPVEAHLFEPAPACLEILRGEFARETAVRIVAAAVGETRGEAVLFGGSAGSPLASLVQRPEHAAAAASTRVPVIRLGDYLAEQGVARVDLLKLDVEGLELAALRGLGENLRPAVIGMIQFEYGGTNLDARTSLRDLYALLTARGYVLAKLLPRALEVRPYYPWMENHAYANYVALTPCRS
jgi:FkbM family methyltransferase